MYTEGRREQVKVILTPPRLFSAPCQCICMCVTNCTSEKDGMSSALRPSEMDIGIEREYIHLLRGKAFQKVAFRAPFVRNILEKVT